MYAHRDTFKNELYPEIVSLRSWPTAQTLPSPSCQGAVVIVLKEAGSGTGIVNPDLYPGSPLRLKWQDQSSEHWLFEFKTRERLVSLVFLITAFSMDILYYLVESLNKI